MQRIPKKTRKSVEEDANSGTIGSNRFRGARRWRPEGLGRVREVAGFQNRGELRKRPQSEGVPFDRKSGKKKRFDGVFGPPCRERGHDRLAGPLRGTFHGDRRSIEQWRPRRKFARNFEATRLNRSNVGIFENGAENPGETAVKKSHLRLFR